MNPVSTKSGYANAIRLMPFFVVMVILALPIAAAAAPFNPDRQAIIEIIINEAPRFRVPTAIALAVAEQESHFDWRAKSSKGAIGVYQILPKTGWDEYRVRLRDLYNVRLNIRVGLHFLRSLRAMYGNTRDALRHYNGGSKLYKASSYAEEVMAKARKWRRWLQGNAAVRSTS